jgi:hypothetical protein
MMGVEMMGVSPEQAKGVEEHERKLIPLEHFPEKWTSGFPQKMRPRKGI